MRRIAGLVLLLTFAATAAWSQTVIDLGPGGGVRSKTWKDYERDGRTPAQQLADSLAYRDCLTRAFNALATDSLAQAETLFRRALKLMPEQPANAIVHYELGLIAGAEADCRDLVPSCSGHEISAECPLVHNRILAEHLLVILNSALHQRMRLVKLPGREVQLLGILPVRPAGLSVIRHLDND